MRHLTVGLLLSGLFFLAGCSGEGDVSAVNIRTGAYVVLAWNDLGMHCLNPTYDEAVILPPYNTVWAQVIERGNPPRIVTNGLTVSYRLLNNSYSYGKTDAWGGDFAQFWDNAQALFGIALPQNEGLNLSDPGLHNGLSGEMVSVGNHFQVDGVPVVPVDDAGNWNPYQVAEITVKDTDTGETLVQTRATVPTSDEINCGLCHGQGGVATGSIGGGGSSAFGNILAVHDAENGTNLVASAPVLCAGCHASPALGSAPPPSAENYLSAAIHGSHAQRGAACYDCHPGEVTRCNRSLAHSSDNGNCATCHGDMAQVASSIESEGRVPWLSEPACSTCHQGVQEVNTGGTLYRNAAGHGGLYCAACHGSPHAMLPSSQASDRYQAQRYQSKAITLGSCGVCHESSRGEGADEFGEKHGGSGGRKTACHVCHTVVPSRTAAWPHAYTWHGR